MFCAHLLSHLLGQNQNVASARCLWPGCGRGGGRSSRRLVMISVSCSPYVVTIEMNFSGSQPCSASSSDCLWCRWKTNFRLYPIFNYMWIIFNFVLFIHGIISTDVRGDTFLLMSQNIIVNGFIRISSNLIPKNNFHILQECNL